MLLTSAGVWLTSTQLNDLGVPSGVRMMIERRLGRLGPRPRQALDAAAVIGQAFDTTTLASVLGIGLDETIDALEEAVKAGLLREEGPGRLCFAHALVRHAAVENHSLTRQARLHWRVAEEIERHSADLSSHLDAIVYHYAAGGQVGDPAPSREAHSPLVTTRCDAWPSRMPPTTSGLLSTPSNGCPPTRPVASEF